MNRLVLFFIISIVLPANHFAQDNEIEAYLAEADRLANEGQLDEAVEYVNMALDLEPLNLEVLERKVSIFLNASKTKSIQKEIEEEIKVSPQTPEYHYLLAMIQLYKQKPKDAIKSLDDAIYYQMPEKHMYKIFHNRGKAYYALAGFENAEEDFKESISRNPKYAAVYHSYGELEYEMKRYDDAKGLFIEALKFDSQNPLYYYNLGMCYMRMDDMENACYNFTRACSSFNYKNACKVYLLECTK